MLTNLHVKNLALIDEAEVEFGPGLNILTGETGAGKSILIGSINAALGKKISREMIRTGETSALVELVFETENPHVLELLKEMDLEADLRPHALRYTFSRPKYRRLENFLLFRKIFPSHVPVISGNPFSG